MPSTTKNCFACFEEVEEKERLPIPCAHVVCISCVRAGLGASISAGGHALICGLCRLPLTACIPMDMITNSYKQASSIHRRKLRARYNTSQEKVCELLLRNDVGSFDPLLATTPFPFPNFHEDRGYSASASSSGADTSSWVQPICPPDSYALRSLSHPSPVNLSFATRRCVIPKCYRLMAPRAISRREAMALKKARYRAIRVRLEEDYMQN